MSCTEIIKFDTEGRMSKVAEVPNASRGAWFVWDYFTVKYLNRHFGVGNDSEYTWRLFVDERLTRVEKIVLGSTYDYAKIRKAELKELIAAYETFISDSDVKHYIAERIKSADGNSAYTVNNYCSLREQIEVLRELAEDNTCTAVGFNQNSVSIVWNYYDFEFEKDFLEEVSRQPWYMFDNVKNDKDAL